MKIEERFVDDIGESLRRSFDCGENDISTMSSFLHEEAPICQETGAAFTKVFIDADNGDSIIGYYSLKASCFQYSEIERHTGEEIIQVVPAVEIARFAVALDYQGKLMPDNRQKVSGFLMFMTLSDIMSLREYALGVSLTVGICVLL